MTSGFAADVTSSLAVVKSKSSKERGRTSSCDLSARQMVVSPARKTGLIRTKSRTRPMAGAAGLFVSSITMARDLSSAENGTVIPGDTISTISACFDASRLMVTHPTLKTSPRKTSPFYRCPGCHEIVDGRDLAAMLLHHRHVLDGYPFGILRGQRGAGKGDPQSEMLRGIKAGAI